MVLYGFLIDLVYFSGCRRASHMMSQGDVQLMEESEQSESCYQSNHDHRLAYFSESYTGSAYTSSNSDSDGRKLGGPKAVAMLVTLKLL